MNTKWKVDESEELPLAVIEDTEDGLGVAEIGERTKRNVKNAKLIASAPELLEALESILADSMIDADDGKLALEALSHIRHTARLAISKATD